MACRLLDHYLYTAQAASRVVAPHRVVAPLAPPAAGVTVEVPPERDAALAWFTAQHANLRAVLRYVAATGRDVYVGGSSPRSPITWISRGTGRTPAIRRPPARSGGARWTSMSRSAT